MITLCLKTEKLIRLSHVLSDSQDSPVGTGYSYVDNDNLFVTTDVEAAIDVTTLLKAIYNGNQTTIMSPLYIFAESYGGKFAVTLALAALQAIETGELKLQLGGTSFLQNI